MKAKILFAIGTLILIGSVSLHWRTPVAVPPPMKMAPAKTASNPWPEKAHPVSLVSTSGQPLNLVSAPDIPTVPDAAAAPAQADRDQRAAELQARQELMAKLRDWAAKDLDGALASVLKMPPGSERDDALQAVCLGCAQTNPAQAVQLALTLQQPGALVENLVQQWGAGDLPAALVWANDQPAGDQRDEFMQRLALVLSQTDAADAAGLVMEQIAPGPAQDEAIMTVVQQWGNQNLAAAATWVKTFPTGPLQARAIEELEGIARYQTASANQ